MISFVRGNLLESRAMALVNTVNCAGVMGRGIALEFKKKYPVMFQDYRASCERGEVKIGRMWTWQNTQGIFTGAPRWIVNFPTKLHWKAPSHYRFITEGLANLKTVIGALEVKSIAIPALGCGNGGLEWKFVRGLLVEFGAMVPDVAVEIYEP